MKVIFFGSTNYSVNILDCMLKAGYKPALVVTQPDRPKGRGLKTTPTEVKRYAATKNLKVITPAELTTENFLTELQSVNPDIYVLVSYGKILPLNVLQLPKIIPLGIHPSLLPKYRGAAPINWPLINGDIKTGVSVYKMENRMDAGPVLLKEPVSIAREDNFLTLSEKLSKLSCRLVIEAISDVEKEKIKLFAQDDNQATYAPKLNKAAARINWNKKAVTVYNLVRGLIPEPCAWAIFRNKRIKFLEAKAQADESYTPSEAGTICVVSKSRVEIKTSKGVLLPQRVQPEAKRPLNITEFINGHRPKVNEKFT